MWVGYDITTIWYFVSWIQSDLPCGLWCINNINHQPTKRDHAAICIVRSLVAGSELLGAKTHEPFSWSVQYHHARARVTVFPPPSQGNCKMRDNKHWLIMIRVARGPISAFIYPTPARGLCSGSIDMPTSSAAVTLRAPGQRDKWGAQTGRALFSQQPCCLWWTSCYYSVSPLIIDINKWTETTTRQPLKALLEGEWGLPPLTEERRRMLEGREAVRWRRGVGGWQGTEVRGEIVLTRSGRGKREGNEWGAKRREWCGKRVVHNSLEHWQAYFVSVVNPLYGRAAAGVLQFLTAWPAAAGVVADSGSVETLNPVQVFVWSRVPLSSHIL